MYISKIRIKNYKSFIDSQEIYLTQGINLIIGKNNSGKTALLEALLGKKLNKPHLNREQKIRSTSKIKSKFSEFEYEFIIDKLQLINLIEDNAENTFIFYNGTNDEKIYCNHNPKLGWHTHEKSKKKLEIKVENIINSFKKAIEEGLIINFKIPSNQTSIKNLYQGIFISADSSSYSFIKIKDLYEKPTLNSVNIGHGKEVSKLVTNETFSKKIFKFSVFRTVEDKSSLEDSPLQLSPNCENLPTVLDTLQRNTNKFAEYTNLVNKIFSEIKDIQIRLIRNNQKDTEAEIKLAMPQSTRDDLFVSLSDCGTGIGQVMAMLYLLVSSEESRILLIDEPNSFLHPSASRKLLEIFSQYPRHQYIITTHSPEVIANKNIDNISLLSLNNSGQTEVRRIDRNSKNDLKSILNEIGGKLSDVFGYDKILWVEGQTEELCFPLIIQKLLKTSTVSIPVLRVKDTGSFEKKHIETSIYIYNRLTKGNALMPPALAFIFDKEGRTEKEIEDLERTGKGDIKFLSKRLYENYLLNYNAIASILSPETSPLQIESYITENYKDKKYWDKKEPTIEMLENWKDNIHGAKLLVDIFHHFSEGKLQYRKTTHSLKLTEWLIENRPSDLDDLKELLSEYYN